MIYTCTTNPSLDYVIELEEQTIAEGNNRSKHEKYIAGGKGVNVSIFLDKLNITSRACGFIGGFTGQHYLSLLKKYKNIQLLFTNIEEPTRINVKFETLRHISFNAKGPTIQNNEFDLFATKLKDVYSNDYFIISGNIQKEIYKNMFELIYYLSNLKCKLILNTDLDFTLKALKFKPYMVMLDDGKIKYNCLDEIKKESFEIIKKGAISFIYCKASKISSIAYEDNFYYFDTNLDYKFALDDCLIAGFVYCNNKGGTILESFKYGLSLQKAYFNDELSLTSKIYSNMKVKEI